MSARERALRAEYAGALAACAGDPPITPAVLWTHQTDCARMRTFCEECDHPACVRARMIDRAHLLSAAAHRMRALDPATPYTVCVYRFCLMRGTAHTGECDAP